MKTTCEWPQFKVPGKSCSPLVDIDAPLAKTSRPVVEPLGGERPGTRAVIDLTAAPCLRMRERGNLLAATLAQKPVCVAYCSHGSTVWVWPGRNGATCVTQSLDCQLTFLLLFGPQFSLSCNSLFFATVHKTCLPSLYPLPLTKEGQVWWKLPGMPWELHGRTVLSMNSMLDSDMQRKKGVNNLTD